MHENSQGMAPHLPRILSKRDPLSALRCPGRVPGQAPPHRVWRQRCCECRESPRLEVLSCSVFYTHPAFL